MRLPKLVVMAGLVVAFVVGQSIVWCEQIKSGYRGADLRADVLDENVTSEKLA